MMHNKTKFIFIIVFFFTYGAYMQSEKKDSIYFQYDKNYILFYENLDFSNYKIFESNVIKNISKTGTEGYFLFKAIDTLYDLKPKQIFDLKDYVEKREFYYAGEHSQTVNKDFLKEKIFNKYKVFIVNNDSFITIRQHPFENFYNSYYPIKYHDKNKYPKPLKDTLFIKYDKKYLIRKVHPNEGYTYYYFKLSRGTDDVFFFAENRKYLKKTKSNITSIEKIFVENNLIRKSKIDNHEFPRDEELYDFFSRKIIYLVKRDSIIELESKYVIID